MNDPSTLTKPRVASSWWTRFTPTPQELRAAIPGLLAVVLPVALVAEFLWYLELRSNNTWFVDIFIAGVLAIILAIAYWSPGRGGPMSGSLIRSGRSLPVMTAFTAGSLLALVVSILNILA